MADVTHIYGNEIVDAAARQNIATNTADISDLKSALKSVEEYGAVVVSGSVAATAGTAVNKGDLFRNTNISNLVGKRIAYRFRTSGANFNDSSALIFNGAGKPLSASGASKNKWYFATVSSDFASSTYHGPYIAGNNITASGTIYVDLIYDCDDTVFNKLTDITNDLDSIEDVLYAPYIAASTTAVAGTNLVKESLIHSPIQMTSLIGKKIQFTFESADIVASNHFRLLNGGGKFLSGEYGLNEWYEAVVDSEFASSNYFGPYIPGVYISTGGTLTVKVRLSYDGSLLQAHDDIEKLDEKISTVSSPLSGKQLWTLWDSLGHNTWQSYFKDFTGCEWNGTLNTKSDKPISMGGTSSLPEEDDGTQARAINLVSYKGTYPIDVVILENINDYKLLDNIGTPSDKPFMRSQKIPIATGQTSRENAIAYAQANLNSILSGISSGNRKKGSILSFNYSNGSNICGSKITFNNQPTSNGNISITWGGNTYSIPVTTSTTPQDMVDAFLQYTFGSGVTDIDSGNGSITITYYTTTSNRATFNANGTGVSATVTDATGTGSYILYYTSDTSSDWLDTTKWVDSVSAYSVYKGLMSYLVSNLPEAKFYWCAPWCASVDFNADTYKNDDGTWSIDKFSLGSRQTLFNIQSAVAEKYGVSVLNLVEESGMSIVNIESYFNSNDVHPKAKGYELYASTIANLIGKLY